MKIRYDVLLAMMALIAVGTGHFLVAVCCGVVWWLMTVKQ
jgi:hypothetical protein